MMMDKMELRDKLIEFKKREERSYQWIANKIGVNMDSLQKFGKGTRLGMRAENLAKLEEFLKKEGM